MLKDSDDPAGVNVLLGVVGGIEGVDLHGVAVGGGVDEIAVANIDAHMGHGGGDLAVIEEDQVAGLELIPGDGHTVVELSGGGAVEVIAEMGVDILGEAGAVKAVGAVAAPDVGLAQKLLGVFHHLLSHGGRGGDHSRCPCPEG